MTHSSKKLLVVVAVAAVVLCGCDLRYSPIPSGAQSGCGSDDPRVGQVAELTNRFVHGVSGTARIVDNCTIVIENFNYDGIAADSRFIILKDYDWNKYDILSGPMMRNGGYRNETITLAFPEGVTLGDMNMISLCCIPGLDFLGNGNLGDGVFHAP